MKPLQQGFWRRWQGEYLQQLQARGKWKTPQKNLAVGELVLLTDANQFVEHWNMARVVTLYPGTDGLVRAVDLKVCKATPTSNHNRKDESPPIKTSLLRRPVTRLVRLHPEEELFDQDVHEKSISSSPGGCLGQSP